MQDTLVTILKILAPVSVAVIVFAEGLSISPRVVLAYFKERPQVVLLSLAAAVVLVPAAALALILILKPAPGVVASAGSSPPSCSARARFGPQKKSRTPRRPRPSPTSLGT